MCNLLFLLLLIVISNGQITENTSISRSCRYTAPHTEINITITYNVGNILLPYRFDFIYSRFKQFYRLCCSSH